MLFKCNVRGWDYFVHACNSPPSFAIFDFGLYCLLFQFFCIWSFAQCLPFSVFFSIFLMLLMFSLDVSRIAVKPTRMQDETWLSLAGFPRSHQVFPFTSVNRVAFTTHNSKAVSNAKTVILQVAWNVPLPYWRRQTLRKYAIFLNACIAHRKYSFQCLFS